MRLTPSSYYFSGLPIRDLLQRIQYQTTDLDLRITLGIIRGTSSDTLEAREKSHLTNATSIDHQIRFALKDRVLRGVRRLAEDVRRYLDPRESLELALNNDDFISIEFFQHIPNSNIILMSGEVDSQIHLTEKELLLLEHLESPETGLQEILKKSQERIYAGDYHCAYKLLSFLNNEGRDDVSYMLGLCTNFFGRTQESETHFRKLLKSPNPLSVVKASYVISMLYLRMHSKDKQDLATAENLLENAFYILNQHPEIEDHTFHQVFNRNGFALCLFRRGHIEEALQMLQRGVARLKEDSSGAKNLHQSVLIYNAVQCLRVMKRFGECESMCQELLAMDPLFPEYHLELSLVYLDQGKVQEAISTLLYAQELDPLIPETKGLLGYAFVQANLFAEAAIYYREASFMDSQQVQWLLDLAYCLSESKQWAELHKTLEKISLEVLSSLQSEAFVALQEELQNNYSLECEL